MHADITENGDILVEVQLSPNCPNRPVREAPRGLAEFIDVSDSLE
jgi:hypothetical protein